VPSRRLARLWLGLVLISLVTGSACALFLWSLDRLTRMRWDNPWLLFLLPLAGVGIGLLYGRLGRRAEGGNNLIIEQIHEPGGGVPARMAPLVLAGTLVTHLFGGSAGREGTAVQMGGSIASLAGRLLRLEPADARMLLMAGVAAGFGAVFGTPLAGAIFAAEVIAIGRLDYRVLLPCLAASMLGDIVCAGWGIDHTHYHIAAVGGTAGGMLDLLLLAKSALAGIVFGLAGALFAETTHRMGDLFRRIVPSPLLRPALGGAIIIGLVHLLGTRDYLGLGVTSPDPGAVTIVSAFTVGGADPWSWWWKILFTAVTLGSGFKGGEVTPLFFVGACLGNTLAALLGAPADLFAGLGFVAVFAGAANTPIACAVMGIELFGGAYALNIAVACIVAYLFSGHTGIYLSQRIARPKPPFPSVPAGSSLRSLRALRSAQWGRIFGASDGR